MNEYQIFKALYEDSSATSQTYSEYVALRRYEACIT